MCEYLGRYVYLCRCIPVGLVVEAVALALAVVLALVLAVVAVGDARPPVRPMFSISRSDCSCCVIQLRTTVLFSYVFRLGRLLPSRPCTLVTVRFYTNTHTHQTYYN